MMIVGFLLSFLVTLKMLTDMTQSNKVLKDIALKTAGIHDDYSAISASRHYSHRSTRVSRLDSNKESTCLCQPSTEPSSADGLAVASTIEIDWKRTKMSLLTTPRIIDYLLWTNQSSCQVAQYFGGNMVFSGLTVAYDGQKAVCLDSQIAPSSKKCLVYSFGINNEWSFDEAMELYGCHVFAFDPSMGKKNHSRTENIHFYQMALDSVDRDGWDKYADVPTRTLSSIYHMLSPHHGNDAFIDYLKVDIEGAEWRVLPQIINSGMMDKVRQLAVEIHLDFDKSVSVYRQVAGVIQSIEDYGMVRFDSKRNMFTVVDFTQVDDVSAAVDYEIAWYNNRLLRHNE